MARDTSAGLPVGTVTFLFTDIEGSTRLLQQLGDAYPQILERHHRLIRDALATHHGVEVATEGDAFFAVFRSAADAVAAATAAQTALASTEWLPSVNLRVRMGLHTGEGRLGGDSYAGIDVHRAARIAASAHGGQIVVSEPTKVLVASGLPQATAIRDLGTHELKDLDAPEHLYQLTVDGLTADFPPPRARRVGNLPTPRTSFVGRDAEVAAVRDLLGTAQLVTLMGPGGTGKTRLALRVAGELADAYADGAFFVGLEGVAEVGVVPSAIARALGLTDRDNADLRERLESHLAQREALLVLDNFEQILPAAELLDELMASAPRVRVVVTSRATLGLYGEQIYPVPPLRLPDLAHLPPPEQLSRYEAIALFVARAKAMNPGFELTADNAPSVAEICARLDGLPLAIELAAARIRLLPPEAIVARLSRGLEVLGTGATNLPERQRTLRRAIQWSYDLLDEPSQGLLECLAVFVDGASLDRVQAICDPGAAGSDLFDGLARLVDNSLVSQASLDGEPRFRLLETIREFGHARLAERGRLESAQARYVADIVGLVEAAEPFLGLTSDMNWYRRIAAESGNVRGALRAALDLDDGQSALRIIAVMWRWWQREGLLSEGRWWCDEVIGHRSASARTKERALGLAAQGSVAYWQGDREAMKVAYEESLVIARELGDPELLAHATFNAGFVDIVAGDIAAGRAKFAEVLESFRASGNDRGTWEALFVVGSTNLMAGELDTAQAALEETLRITPVDWFRRADAMVMLGQAYRLRGDQEGARQMFLDSLDLARRLRDSGIVIGALEMVGVVDLETGQVERGARIVGASRGLRQKMGGGPPQTLVLVEGAYVLAEATLGKDRFDALVAEGELLTEEQAVALATGAPVAAR